MDAIDIKVLWKTVALLVALAIFASPSASLPLLVLYGVLALFAVLLPVRSVPNTVLISIVGGVSIVVGGWLAVRQEVSGVQLAGFVLLGACALALPYAPRLRERLASDR